MIATLSTGMCFIPYLFCRRHPLCLFPPHDHPHSSICHALHAVPQWSCSPVEPPSRICFALYQKPLSHISPGPVIFTVNLSLHAPALSSPST